MLNDNIGSVLIDDWHIEYIQEIGHFQSLDQSAWFDLPHF